jgi:hypothetical protein
MDVKVQAFCARLWRDEIAQGLVASGSDAFPGDPAARWDWASY